MLPVYFISSDDKCLYKHLLCLKLKDILKCFATVSPSPSLVYLHSRDSASRLSASSTAALKESE